MRYPEFNKVELVSLKTGRNDYNKSAADTGISQ
jgi:hypothetical protein